MYGIAPLVEVVHDGLGLCDDPLLEVVDEGGDDQRVEPHLVPGLRRSQSSPVPQAPKPCTGTELSVLNVFSLSV